MLQSVSPFLTTYQPGSSIDVPAAAQVRDCVPARRRLRSARAIPICLRFLARDGGALPLSIAFSSPALRGSGALPASTGFFASLLDGACATLACCSASLALPACAASISADRRSAA